MISPACCRSIDSLKRYDIDAQFVLIPSAEMEEQASSTVNTFVALADNIAVLAFLSVSPEWI